MRTHKTHTRTHAHEHTHAQRNTAYESFPFAAHDELKPVQPLVAGRARYSTLSLCRVCFLFSPASSLVSGSQHSPLSSWEWLRSSSGEWRLLVRMCAHSLSSATGCEVIVEVYVLRSPSRRLRCPFLTRSYFSPAQERSGSIKYWLLPASNHTRVWESEANGRYWQLAEELATESGTATEPAKRNEGQLINKAKRNVTADINKQTKRSSGRVWQGDERGGLLVQFNTPQLDAFTGNWWKRGRISTSLPNNHTIIIIIIIITVIIESHIRINVNRKLRTTLR